MGNGKKGVLVVAKKNNPVTHFKNWIAKQPIAVEAAVLGGAGAVVGGAVSFSLDIIYSVLSLSRGVNQVYDIPLAPTMPICIGGGALEARNMAVIGGTYGGITRVLKRLKGKEDVQTTLVAGFGAGVMVSLVSGIKGTNAIANGVFVALVNGGIFKALEISSQHKAEDMLYKKTKGVLSSLGLNHYEKNFRKGSFTDKALPLLSDRDLQEVEIPAGARRLILDHIQREKKVDDIVG